MLEGVYGAFLMAVLIPLNPVLRWWHLTWGCTKEEANMVLPGDELVKNLKTDATHAITIHKPATAIWPWLVQIGVNRGGFYSYELLENLVGCGLKNVSTIIPELQSLKEGDYVTLHPKAPPLRVNILKPNEGLVLAEVWGFHLKPIDANSTRLIVRARGDFNSGLNRFLDFVIWRIFYEPIHFMMERKMMVNIKKLAEGS